MRTGRGIRERAVCIAVVVVTTLAAAPAGAQQPSAEPSPDLERRAVYDAIQRLEALERMALVATDDPRIDVPTDSLQAARDELRVLLERLVFDRPDGEEELDRLRAMYPGRPLFEAMAARLALRDGDAERAAALYADLVERRPRSLEYQLGRARALERLGRTDAALSVYARALDLAPEGDVAFRALLRLHTRAGSLRVLAFQLDRLRRLYPESERIRSRHGLVEARVAESADSVPALRRRSPGPRAPTIWPTPVPTGSQPETVWLPADASDSAAAQLQGQEAEGFDFPVRASGYAQFTSEGYLHSGIAARRPDATWRLAMSPRVSLFGEINMGLDLLLSSDQVELRQNINQIGLSPSWRWLTLHVGDFSRDYSSMTVQGVRVRGAGLDLEPGLFRFSIQGGRLQRSTTTAGGGPVYRRNMIAMSLGYGREGDSYLRLNVVTAGDDPSQEELDLITVDTVLVDTITPGLRPRSLSTPQEGLAASVNGQLTLFDRAVTLRGEVASSIFTSDITADRVALDSEELPVADFIAGLLGDVQPIRVSTTAGYAYSGEATARYGPAQLRGGYEYVGAGYASLGLPYLIGDRQGWDLAGSVQLLEGRLGVNSQFNHRTNNLESQRLNTVDRNTVAGSVTAMPLRSMTTVLTAASTSVTNDAVNDSARLDTRSWTVGTNLSLQHGLLGREVTSSLGYTIQRTSDANPLAAIAVTTHNVRTGIQVSLSETVTAGPSVSGVVTETDGGGTQENIYLGFAGRGRFLDGALVTSTNLSHTVSQGRQITTGSLRASYPVGLGADLSLQARHNEYSAFGTRPAFRETFITLSLSRSF